MAQTSSTAGLGTAGLPYDEPVQATVYGAQLAEWGIFARYDANHVTYGPYWVMVDGVSDVFFGMGLPWNRHVSFTVVYQRMTWRVAARAVELILRPRAIKGRY